VLCAGLQPEYFEGGGANHRTGRAFVMDLETHNPMGSRERLEVPS